MVGHTQAYRQMASREERELQDVERAMEEELVAEHMQVERIIFLRMEADHTLKYLVKVCTHMQVEHIILCTWRLTDSQISCQGVCASVHGARLPSMHRLTKTSSALSTIFHALPLRSPAVPPVCC